MAGRDPAPRPGGRIDGRCPLCNGCSLVMLPFRYAFAGRYLYGVECSSCRLAFIHPQPTDAEIADLYKEEYFTECTETCGAHGPSAYMEMAASSGEERGHAARKLDALIVSHRGGRGRLLEIGCGPGFFLAELRALGWEARGLEISEFAARHAREALGLDVVHGSIEPGTFPAGTFDAIFMGDVLEHLPRPAVALETLRDWLRPGGILVIAVPSTLNLVSAKLGMRLFKIRGKYKTLRIPPYHLFEYTPPTLRKMAENSGFDCLRLRQSAVPIGRMGLRGTPIENAGKVALQVFALASSRLLNRGGDRLLLIAARKER